MAQQRIEAGKALVADGSEESIGPLFCLGGALAEGDAGGGMHVFGQVVEVQDDGRQVGQ